MSVNTSEVNHSRKHNKAEFILIKCDLLTSWSSPQNKFANFIIDEDEQAVWKSTEPPVHPTGEKEEQKDKAERVGEGEMRG